MRGDSDVDHRIKKHSSDVQNTVGDPFRGTPGAAEEVCPSKGSCLMVEVAPLKAHCALKGAISLFRHTPVIGHTYSAAPCVP